MMEWLEDLFGEKITMGRHGPLYLFPYHLPMKRRETHGYILGLSGSGKSQLALWLIVQDILAGRGVVLVDPHSDLARDVMAYLASAGYFRHPRHTARLIYLDPTRTDYVLPFNVLKSPRAPHEVSAQVIEAFRRTWPQALAEAPRFTVIAQAALLALIDAGLSLVDMPRLLTDKEFREGVLARARNADAVAFFHHGVDRWGRDAATMMDSVYNKVMAFTLNPVLKRMLGASDNRLNFRTIMDNRQVLIVDVGRCDGETRRLIGSLIVTGIEQAAMSRTELTKEEIARARCFMYLDEFQDFCAGEGSVKTLAQILSETRKFGLHLTLAHQTLGQLHPRLIAALTNCGVKVVFTVSRRDAEVLVKDLFAVDTDAIKHDAQTEVQHPYFDPLPEQWERSIADLQDLPARVAYVKRRRKRAVRMRTVTIPPSRVTREQVEALLSQLARVQGVPVTGGTAAVEPPAQPSSAEWVPLPTSAPVMGNSGVVFTSSL